MLETHFCQLSQMQWAPLPSALTLQDPCKVAGSPTARSGRCVPPAVFSMPRCFLLQVLTPCKSGKGTELSWSHLSAPTMHSEFSGFRKVFFPYSVPHLALVSECSLLATVKITREINFSEGNFVVRARSNLTDKMCISFFLYIWIFKEVDSFPLKNCLSNWDPYLYTWHGTSGQWQVSYKKLHGIY